MPETIKIPAIGPVDKRYVWIGGAAVAGIVGYAWWNAGSSAAPTVVDPDVDSGGLVGDLTGDGSYDNPAPSGGYGGTATGNEAPRTNPEWTQAAVDYLSAQGFEPSAVSTALAKYLDRQPLTTDEATMVRRAWAGVGRPPETPGLAIIPMAAAPTNPPPSGGTTVTPAYYKPGVHAIGKPGGRYSLRDIAKKSLPSNNQSANAVEAKLRQIVAANPFLRGKTFVVGGTKIRIP